MPNQGLINKLVALRATLTPEEQQAFGAMVKLAAGAAEAIIQEDMSDGTAVTAPGGLLKTQSSHAALTPAELATMYKTQSSHSVFSLQDLDQLVP